MHSFVSQSMKRLFLCALLLPTGLLAVDRISIESKVIESARKAIPHDLTKLSEGRYLKMTRPPTASTRPGNPATVNIIRELTPAAVPMAFLPPVPVGVTVRIDPVLRDNRIVFTGQITLSELLASTSSEKQSCSEVKSRTLYISGSVRSGDDIWYDLKESADGKKTTVWMRLTHEEVPEG